MSSIAQGRRREPKLRDGGGIVFVAMEVGSWTRTDARCCRSSKVIGRCVVGVVV
jgi:hypothetical protein